jgi:addiction module HigA family antidote
MSDNDGILPTTTRRRPIARDPRRVGVAIHPGEILLEDYLRPLGLSQAALARHLGFSVARVNELIKGKRGVSAETAWLLGEAFATSPQFWLNLQASYDLATYRPARHVTRLRKVS